MRELEQNEVLRDCISRFERLAIPYMLTGSMAMVYWAMPRTTTDIDIVVELTVEDAGDFIDAFSLDYYIPQDWVREAIRLRRMFNILNQNTIVKVDCIIRKDDDFHLNAFERRLRVNYTGDLELWIITKEDLILAKLDWARDTHSELQMRDVVGILRNGYDIEYVDFWASRMGLVGMLAECRSLLRGE